MPIFSHYWCTSLLSNGTSDLVGSSFGDTKVQTVMGGVKMYLAGGLSGNRQWKMDN